jgi:MHS family alpha-ketoglutarate permease-like MFS transporter
MPARPHRLRSILGGSAGNLVEWYDWYAYSAFTLYFAHAFFPAEDRTAQLLSAAAVFAVGFLMRPIGGWLMGVYADRKGRKAGLTLSVSLMCTGSLAIALTPTYAQIGPLAPLVLVVARMVQGLSLGGEYGASATYLSEMAGRRHRGFWSSFQYVTLIAGQLTALALLLLLQAVLTETQIDAWGWRVAFFIGAGLAVVVFFVQWSLQESHSYKNAKAAGETSGSAFGNLSSLFTRYWKETLIIMGLTAAGTSGFYAYTTYMLKFLQNSAHFSKVDASSINFVVLVVFMLFQPVAGWLSDIVGRKTTLVGGFGISVLLAVPIYTMVAKTTDMTTTSLLCIAPLIVLSGYTSISAVVKAELFPAHVRALGVALPYALSNAVFGALVEPLALGWKQAGTESYFYWYMAGVFVLGLIAAIAVHETSRGRSMILED